MRWNTRASMCCLSCLVAVASAACSQAPTVDIMGALFPAWLLCITIGVLLAALAHWLFVRNRIDLLYPLLAYPCLAAIFTFSTWLIFFS
jgi:hypothetical protein